MTTSISDIRPGDKVIVRYFSPYLPGYVAIVDRVTKTQVIVGTHRFRISDGLQLSGGRWSCHWISPATPSAIAEKDQKRACQLLKQIDAQVSARDSPNAAAAIPHLEAALAALNTHLTGNHD